MLGQRPQARGDERRHFQHLFFKSSQKTFDLIIMIQNHSIY
jgi:hypothetical protein